MAISAPSRFLVLVFAAVVFKICGSSASVTSTGHIRDTNAEWTFIAADPFYMRAAQRRLLPGANYRTRPSGNRSQLCKNKANNCIVSSTELCRCAEGYGARKTGTIGTIGLFGTLSEYTCLPDIDGDEVCSGYSSTYWSKLSMGLLCIAAVGASGFVIVVLKERLARKDNAKVKLSAEDMSVEGEPIVRDGAKLTRAVPMDRWCVTRKDLMQFRRLVMHAVREGRIQPSSRDPFDPLDNHIGPSIHTVNAQFIKPVTEAAGKTSWALMKNPDGLPCDLFVTHGWQEGVFEFIDKVLQSWPRNAKAAYCCMLSNPQSLDISDLIKSPSDSPFAHALGSSKHFLVVPNHVESIYARTWCTYEAFLAYVQNKYIVTVSTPTPDVWLQMLKIACMSVFYSALFSFLCARLHVAQQHSGNFGRDLIRLLWLISIAFGVVGKLTIVALWKRGQRGLDSLCLRIAQVVTIAAASLSAATYIVEASSGTLSACGPFLVMLVASCLIKLDTLRLAEAAQQKSQLDKGFTGHVRDAKCSVAADRDAIMAEITDADCEAAVDKAIHVLIRMGLSTPEIRVAADRAGALGDMKNYSLTLSWALLFFSLWVISYTFEIMDYHPWFLAMETWLQILWGAIFAYVPRERKAFSARIYALTCVLIFACRMVVGIAFDNPLAAQMIRVFFLLPMNVCCSAAGPGNCARVPCLGPKFIRLLFGAKKDRFKDSQQIPCSKDTDDHKVSPRPDDDESETVIVEI